MTTETERKRNAVAGALAGFRMGKAPDRSGEKQVGDEALTGAAPQPSKWDRVKQVLWDSNLNAPIRGAYNLMNADPYTLMTDTGAAGQQAAADSFDAAGGVTVGSMPMPKPSNALTMGIKAYHGSPHSFDKFSMDKIGTGEGAQAYGHGLYFAENEGVARSYRDQLKRGDNNSIVHIGDKEFPADMGNYYIRQATERVAPPEATNFASGKETYDFYNKELGDAAYRALKKADPSQDPVAVMAAAMDEKIAKLSPYQDELPSVLAMKNATLEYAKNNIRLAPNGSVYEVNIDADPNAFLDWDKPLSEQSEAVRTALKNVNADSSGMSVRDRVDTIEAAMSGDPRLAHLLSDKSINLPGDVIHQKMFHAARKEAGGNQGAGVYQEAVRKQLNEAGIPGIKYLDAGSRGAGDGTRNYVVFDDKLVSIVKKYGIAGASALLGYNIMDGLSDAQAAELTKASGGGRIGGLTKQNQEQPNAY